MARAIILECEAVGNIKFYSWRFGNINEYLRTKLSIKRRKAHLTTSLLPFSEVVPPGIVPKLRDRDTRIFSISKE